MSALLLHVAASVLNTPLALHPRKAAAIAFALGTRVGLDGHGAEALVRSQAGASLPTTNAKPRTEYAKSNGIATVSIIGSLVNRGSWIDAESGLVSYDAVKRQMYNAALDDDVSSIVADFSSPGGEAAGCMECADFVHSLSQKKPIIAVVNSMAASAAFALAAACSEIVVSPTAVVGSIGVCLIHSDYSRQIDGRGITPTIITAGKHKADGNYLQPLSEAVKDDLQAEVNTLYDLFTSSVAKHRRKLGLEAIRATEARCYIGADAVRMGLADRIGTIEQVRSELAQLHPVVAQQGRRAEMFERITQADLDAARSEGVRRGAAAALAGRSA